MKNTSNISWRLLKALSLCFLLSSSSCDKTEPPPPEEGCDGPLPCATQEGKNTFGCYVDGKAFVADVPFSIGGPSEVTAVYLEEENRISIAGRRDAGGNSLEKIEFSILNYSGSGVYEAHVNTSIPYVGYQHYNNNVEYYHDYSSTITISTLNTTENFIAGTFEMELKNPEYGADSLMTITDGRFDIRY